VFYVYRTVSSFTYTAPVTLFYVNQLGVPRIAGRPGIIIINGAVMFPLRPFVLFPVLRLRTVITAWLYRMALPHCHYRTVITAWPYRTVITAPVSLFQ